MQEIVSPTNTKLSQFRSGLKPTSILFSKETLEEANQLLEKRDFPTTREESWKYTRLTKLANTTFSGSVSSNNFDIPFVHADSYRFIFTNGQLTEFNDGVNARSVKDVRENNLNNISLKNHFFEAINLAFAEDGLFIEIEANQKLEKPIEIVHVSNGNKITNLRHVFRVGRHAKAEITMTYVSSDESNGFLNVVSNIALEDGAYLTINKLQTESGTDFHFSREAVKQEKNSNFTLNTLTFNGNFVRNDVNVFVNGQNAETNLNGAYLVKNNQLVDNHTIVDHLVANCQSNELYKGVLYGKSTAVFNGKVFVRPDAQKINAFQSNGNVLLSDDASVNSKPELEIYADDVKCSHGSTTGQLDENAVFYLRARGLSEKSAKELLVSAFISDVLNKIENEEVLNFTHSYLNKEFGWNI
ncbi:MAG: Fe-S cluster assembly protein SufD [Bacteroidetes bacterium]|nr:Fe-S cluster assembly protein SufD [Bacteroidota bacterium]